MRVTNQLVKELCEDIETEPETWLRSQQWLFKKFMLGRVGLRVFGRFPYTLELDASLKQHGNLDTLTAAQSWRLRRARLAWLASKHGKTQKLIAEERKNAQGQETLVDRG